MADKGQWVQVPRNLAPGSRDMRIDLRIGEGHGSPAVRWQNEDGSLQFRGPGGAQPPGGPGGAPPPGGSYPAWRAPVRQGNYVSKFAGARAENQELIRTQGRDNRGPGEANRRAEAAQALARRQPPAAQPPARPATQPRAAAPQSSRPAPAPAAPSADPLEQAGAVVSGLQQQYFSGPPLIAETPSVYVQPTPDQEIAIRNLAPGAAPAAAGVMDDAQLNQRRRSAFLDAKDSMSGLAAVRGLLSEQAQARGADLSGGGPIPSVRFLEAQLAKNPARQSVAKTADLPESDQQVWGQMAFENQPITQVIQGAGGAVMEPPATATPAVSGGGLAPEQIAQAGFAAQEQVIPSGAPRAAVNGYMQSALKEKLRATQQPLNEIAQWQLTPQPIQAPRTDPGREAALAAFAARGEQPPTTEGMGLLAAGAGNAFGTRGGQFKPGNTVNLGFVDASQLPPLNSAGFYAGVRLNPGNF